MFWWCCLLQGTNCTCVISCSITSMSALVWMALMASLSTNKQRCVKQTLFRTGWTNYNYIAWGVRSDGSQFKSCHVECVSKRLLTFIVVFCNNSAKCWGLQTLILYRKIISQFCFSGCLKKDTLWQKHNISPKNTHVDGTHCFWWINCRQAKIFC